MKGLGCKSILGLHPTNTNKIVFAEFGTYYDKKTKTHQEKLQ